MDTPGRNGRPHRTAAASSSGVAPGLTAKPAPTERAFWSPDSSRTVPMPTSTSGNALMMFLALCSAASVRSVISSTCRPPSISAAARGTASSTEPICKTGITVLGGSCAQKSTVIVSSLPSAARTAKVHRIWPASPAFQHGRDLHPRRPGKRGTVGRFENLQSVGIALSF